MHHSHYSTYPSPGMTKNEDNCYNQPRPLSLLFEIDTQRRYTVLGVRGAGDITSCLLCYTPKPHLVDYTRWWYQTISGSSPNQNAQYNGDECILPECLLPSNSLKIFSGFEHTRRLITNGIDTVRKGLEDFNTVWYAILAEKAGSVPCGRKIDPLYHWSFPEDNSNFLGWLRSLRLVSREFNKIITPYVHASMDPTMASKWIGLGEFTGQVVADLRWD